MIKIKFIEPDGTVREIEGVSGDTIMQTAVRNDIEGIIGECGGSCMCATCHIRIAPEWAEKLAKPAEMELETIEFNAVNFNDDSRLSCQITLDSKHDGLVVQVVGEQ